jgi:hypothetical protein
LTAWSAIGSPPSLQRKEPPAFASGSKGRLQPNAQRDVTAAGKAGQSLGKLEQITDQ